MRHAVAFVLLLWASVATAEVNVYPPDGKLVGIATSETPGRWLVFRAAPFGVVVHKPCQIGEQGGCMWFDSAGTFTAVLIPADDGLPMEFGTVVLSGGDVEPDPDPDPGPDPDPDPDPDPQPEPGPRQIIIFHESAERTPELAQIADDVQDWARPLGHSALFLDDDVVGPDGEPLPRKTAILNAIRDQAVSLPAMAIIAESNGDTWIKAYPVPETSDEAIALIKENGG